MLKEQLNQFKQHLMVKWNHVLKSFDKRKKKLESEIQAHESESEANITVSLDMVPNKFPDGKNSVVTGRPRGVKDVRSKLNKIFENPA